VKLVEIGQQEKRVKDISAQDFNNYIPKNGDSIFVGAVLSRFENRVVINGAVNRPGTYELKNGLTLKQLLQTAEGLRPDVSLNRGYLDRISSTGERTVLSFSLDNILKGTEPDIALIKEDSIYIYSKDDLKSLTSVTVGGAVRNPGVFTYRTGMTAEDIIAMAGGFTINAATHKVEISRLEKNTADTLANQMINLFTVNIDSALQHNSKQFNLQPLDYVFVPELLNYRVLGNIKVRGEILYPGDYTLERRDESVNELIKRAGGISPFCIIKRCTGLS
jgi:protein involved in polysaccharide export with SLBB domain